MSRLNIKDAGVGMRVTNRRTHLTGIIKRCDVDEKTGRGRLRVELDGGRRLDIVDDGSGELRWSAARKRNHS